MKNFSYFSSPLYLTFTLLLACSSDPEAGTGSAASRGATGTGGETTLPANSGGSSSGGSGSGSGSGGESSGGADTQSSGGSAAGGQVAATGGSETAGEAAKSAGCGMETSQAKGMWVTNSVAVSGQDRNYDVRLPPTYDPQQAYPVILLLHGCGSPTNNVPMEQPAGDEAIIVRGSGSNDGCWQETASGDDLPYVDAFMEQVQDLFCVDTDQLFAVGYSSGSWLASTLSCHRGDVYRGIASVAGGEPAGANNCAGQHGRIFIHDQDDPNNQLAWDLPSRNRMLMTNNCEMETEPYDPSPCVKYQGCDEGYPVVWCETSGQGHSRQDELAKAAFWNFFQELMQ